MGHADFASRMDTFLPKDSINESISTLRTQNQPEFLPPKRRVIPLPQPFNLSNNKKQKANPMAPPRKVEIIRRKKTHNGYYCQQCRIYYQGYKHRCPTPIPTPQPRSNSSFYQYRSSSPTTDSEGEEWINSNPMIVKLKAKSLIPKEFDSWPKFDPKGKWNADQIWGEPDESEWC